MNGIVCSLQEGEEEQSDESWLMEVDSNKRKEVGPQLSDEEFLDYRRPPEEDEELPNGDRLLDDHVSNQEEETGFRNQLLTNSKRVMASEQLLLQQVFLSHKF